MWEFDRRAILVSLILIVAVSVAGSLSAAEKLVPKIDNFIIKLLVCCGQGFIFFIKRNVFLDDDVSSVQSLFYVMNSDTLWSVL